MPEIIMLCEWLVVVTKNKQAYPYLRQNINNPFKTNLKLCKFQVKYVDHMENDQVKECWHQNVTQCHDTYITEFLPSQEQKCEETFWKSCKIDFKEVPFNYSLKQCHTPLIKVKYRIHYGLSSNSSYDDSL